MSHLQLDANALIVVADGGGFLGGHLPGAGAVRDLRKVVAAVTSGCHDIEVWGDGEQTRSFTDTDDCVEGTKLMASDVRDRLNIGSDELVTVNQLVDIVEQIEQRLGWAPAKRLFEQACRQPSIGSGNRWSLASDRLEALAPYNQDPCDSPARAGC